ncbi:AI-2E family transporter [Pseudonocardia kujensis]|uniref:AI-2E family transporter n=1 Tax=Pseudonocardia kujensis TaxID=1128675 RepID=UPI001E35D5F0|nr:AI-2E family transporter [Pseudonocardia kujensis]MCE0766615.1 AI-2E family transporter [Pseudonocardia kujensis]
MTTPVPPPAATPDDLPGNGTRPRERGLPRALVVLLGAAAVVVVLAGVKAVAWLIAPAFMALIIVIAVAPVQDRLKRKGWPAWATTLVLVLLVYAVLIVLALGIVASIARLATEVPKYASQADGLVTSLTSALKKAGVGPDQLKQAASSLDLGKLAGLLGSLLDSVAGLASSLVFLLALLLFLTVEAGGVRDRLASIGADRPEVIRALGHFAWGTRQYLLVTTIFGFIVAVLDSIALALLKVPLAVTWGLLAFVTNYIPNIGFVIGLIPPALLALFVGGPQLAIVVVVVYCALNFVIQSLLQPRFIGDAVGLSITITFVALFFWAWLLGPLGAILAIPLTLLVKALLVDIDPQARWADAWLRSTPKEAEEAAADQEAKAARKAERKAARKEGRNARKAHRHPQPAGVASGASGTDGESAAVSGPAEPPEPPRGDPKVTP